MKFSFKYEVLLEAEITDKALSIIYVLKDDKGKTLKETNRFIDFNERKMISSSDRGTPYHIRNIENEEIIEFLKKYTAPILQSKFITPLTKYMLLTYYITPYYINSKVIKLRINSLKKVLKTKKEVKSDEEKTLESIPPP